MMNEQTLDLSYLLTPEGIADPYPLFHRLRAEAPVHSDRTLMGWVVTRYADCQALLHDPRLRAFKSMSSERASELGLTALEPYYRMLQTEVFFQDPPQHTRLRRLMGSVFTPQRIEGMRASIERWTDEMLDAVADAGEMDLVRDLAFPLPALVIARLLGLPDADVPRFRTWADDAIPLMTYNPPEAAEIPRLVRSGQEYTEYFHALIADRRTHRRDDLISALLGAEEKGYRLSDEEVIGNAFGLLFAGHETSNGVISAGLLALLRAPDQLARLRRDPALVPSAVEELLRHQGSALGSMRLAGEDLEIGGQAITRGEPVFLMVAAANRDPAQFPDPDRLDVGRTNNRHLAFGYSHHFCMGAPLARLEIQCVLTAILRRMPGLRLADAPPVWAPHVLMRTLKSLPVRF